MRQRSAYDEEVADFRAPSSANANLICQFLVVGGGLSGLSAAEAAIQRGLEERDITNAWSGAVYYTLDDYPFVERRHGGRMITFAAPSDHGNALALRVGEVVGDFVAHAVRRSQSDEAVRRRRYLEQQLRLFEAFPKGLRLRPGKRYQEAIP